MRVALCKELSTTERVMVVITSYLLQIELLKLQGLCKQWYKSGAAPLFWRKSPFTLGKMCYLTDFNAGRSFEDCPDTSTKVLAYSPAGVLELLDYAGNNSNFFTNAHWTSC